MEQSLLAFAFFSCGIGESRPLWECTVVVAEESVQVNRGFNIVTSLVLQFADEDMVVLHADVLGSQVEAHFEVLKIDGESSRMNILS